MRKIGLFSLSLFLLLGCKAKEERKGLLLAVAANMQYAIKEIGLEFTKETSIPLQYTISSSGKLTAQINSGAPYDVLISANKKYPEYLEQQSKTVGDIKGFAFGKLILWTKHKDLHPSLELLKSDRIQKIALANPRTAPYGTAAKEVLEHLNLDKELQEKLVFGESIAQTNQFIDTKSATIGFTASSVLEILAVEERGNSFEIPKELYKTIEQTVVVLKGAKEREAQMFYTFLSSLKVKNILKKYGYGIIDS